MATVASEWEGPVQAGEGDRAGPSFRHAGCGGRIITWRRRAKAAVSEGYCGGCGARWRRRDGRFSWQPLIQPSAPVGGSRRAGAAGEG